MGNIGSTNSDRIFSLSSMNVAALRTTDAIDSLITNLHITNIDIARIQETHNDRNGQLERKITPSSAAGIRKKLNRQQINQEKKGSR